MKRYLTVAVVCLLSLQYLAISNIGAGTLVLVGDTSPYGSHFSYLPLPAGVVDTLHPVLRVITLPMPWIVAGVIATPRAHWPGRFARAALTPFGAGTPAADRKNHVVLAFLNSAIWLLVATLARRFSRWFRRTTPHARSLAVAGGALFLTAILVFVALRFWYPADIEPNFTRAFP